MVLMSSVYIHISVYIFNVQQLKMFFILYCKNSFHSVIYFDCNERRRFPAELYFRMQFAHLHFILRIYYVFFSSFVIFHSSQNVYNLTLRIVSNKVFILFNLFCIIMDKGNKKIIIVCRSLHCIRN